MSGRKKYVTGIIIMQIIRRYIIKVISFHPFIKIVVNHIPYNYSMWLKGTCRCIVFSSRHTFSDFRNLKIMSPPWKLQDTHQLTVCFFLNCKENSATRYISS